MRAGQVLGVRIILNDFFLLALVAYALLGFLPEALTFFGAALLHETAHVVAARAYGLRVQEMEILPFGGVARIEDLDLTSLDPQVEAAVALAGPAENMILAAAAWLLSGYGIWDVSLAGLFFRANTTLALFNLLPALPLDGGRLLRSALSQRLPWRQATEIATRLGQALGVLIVLLALLLCQHHVFALSAALAGVFIWSAAESERRSSSLVLIRYLVHKQAGIKKGQVLPGQVLVVAANSYLKEVVKELTTGRYHLIWVLDREGRLLGTLGEGEFSAALFSLGPNSTFQEALSRRC
ncbi:MAG: peptidase M50 [Firmicutes bacterium]|nr:peptidase M50 [Bacillota bacterium]